MKTVFCFCLILAIVFAIPVSARNWISNIPTSPPQPRLIVGYLPSFRLPNFPIKELETRGAAERLTHILYAFTNVASAHPTFDDDETEYQRVYTAKESIDGEADDPANKTALRGAFNQLRKLKTRHPQLKVLMSIGGANTANSRGFSQASRTKASRENFVSACIDLLIRGQLPHGVSAKGVFDGLDIDWEYPTDCSPSMTNSGGCLPEDTANFTLLLQEFRRQLDEQGAKDGVHYQLTMASSAWVDDYSKYEWRMIHPVLDFINVMTYGLAPPGMTRPHSALYKSSKDTFENGPTFNTDYAVTRYQQEGVPANKIVMGVPFYAHGWQGVPNINHGLYQKAAGPARGSIGEGDEQYSRLKTLKGFRQYRDPETQSVWLYNPTSGVLWSYDDPTSLAVKMEYLKRKNLAGVMFWELSGDDENGSLLKAIYRGLRQ
jgi:chitinase